MHLSAIKFAPPVKLIGSGRVASGQASDPTMAMPLIAVILFGFQMAIGNVQTLPSDYFSDKSVGTLAGLGGTAAACGTLLFSTVLIPMISEDNYDLVFILGGGLIPLGIGVIYLFGGDIERIDLKKLINTKLIAL